VTAAFDYTMVEEERCIYYFRIACISGEIAKQKILRTGFMNEQLQQSWMGGLGLYRDFVKGRHREQAA
jgi:hypothetical protein